MSECSWNSEEHAERLLAYCAGRLDAAAAAHMRQHIETCAECVRLCGSQSTVWNALGRWEAPPVSVDFNRRLYARIEAADAAPWYRRFLDLIEPVFARPALPLAGAAAIVVAGFLLDHPVRHAVLVHQTAIERSGVSASDAEQVEKTLDDLEMLRQFDVNSELKLEGKEKKSKSM